KSDSKMYTSPQCVLCETYPPTVCGYVDHLYKKHKSTLIQNDIYLLCLCGIIVRTMDIDPYHNKMCDGRQFTKIIIHKLVNKIHSTPQCVLC
ncbi:hypothetical protein PENTCL1PPCAC_13213, partial [Pristionchus entomophagus]